MIKVIETNLSMSTDDYIFDHQSRVIEVESWEEIIEEVRNGITKIRKSYLGNLSGCSVPKQAVVKNFTFDNNHLMCDIINYAGQKTKKLIYKI